jgi:hypothetical protein
VRPRHCRRRRLAQLRRMRCGLRRGCIGFIYLRTLPAGLLRALHWRLCVHPLHRHLHAYRCHYQRRLRGVRSGKLPFSKLLLQPLHVPARLLLLLRRFALRRVSRGHKQRLFRRRVRVQLRRVRPGQRRARG